jgi:hypothetical protein
MLEPQAHTLSALNAAPGGLHVVTAGDRSVEMLYGALAASGEQVLLLDSQATLTDLITELSGHQEAGGIGSLHLYSHGEQGRFWVGGTEISNDTITGLQDQLSQLGQTLHSNGDLLIYGCHVAAGDAGQALVKTLGSFTGADVAASVDATGNEANGGNWDLEFQWGDIQQFSGDLHLNLAWQGTLAVTPGAWTTAASFIDTNGDLVEVALTGDGEFQLALAGGLTNNADATALTLRGTNKNSGLSVSVTPLELSINAGSILQGENGLYNRMFSSGYTSLQEINSAASSTGALKSIALSGAIVNSIDLPGYDIGNITLDTGFTTYVDRVNTSSLSNTSSIESSTNFNGNTIEGGTNNQAEIVDFAGVFDDEAPMTNGGSSYNPVTGLIDLGDITAKSIGSLVINGAISAPTGDPYDKSFNTNDLRGEINVSGRIGSIDAIRSRLNGNIQAGSIGSINLGRIDGSITTSDSSQALTIQLPYDYQGFIGSAGHLNLAYTFEMLANTSSGGGEAGGEENNTTGEIRSLSGISGIFPEETDTIYIPDQYAGVIINSSKSKGIADVNINGIGMSRWISKHNIGNITANAFTESMIVEADGNIGDIETYILQAIPQETPPEPPEPSPVQVLAGFFQAGGNIGNVKSATSVGADLRAVKGNIGSITALTGGIDSVLIDAGGNIGEIWAHNQAVANSGKIVAQTGSIGDLYLGSGIWGSSLRSGQDIGNIYIEKGKLETANIAADRNISSIKIKGTDAITGGSITAGRAIGDITVSAGSSNAINGVLIQAGDANGQYQGERTEIASIGNITVTAFGATLLEPVEPGPTQQPERLTNGIQNSQILAGEIGAISARGFTGSGLLDTVIHAQQGDIQGIRGVGNVNGLQRINAVAEKNIGDITGLSQVQGNGISESQFFANGSIQPGGSIGLITGRGGVAGGTGIFNTYIQSSALTAGVTASSNANGGHAIELLTVNAGTLGNLKTTVLGGEGGLPGGPLSSGIVDSTFTTFSGSIGDINVDTRSINGEGIANTIFESNKAIGAINVAAFNSNAVINSSFIASSNLAAIEALSGNAGTALSNNIFLSKKGAIGNISANSGGGGIQDHAISGSEFTAYTGIGVINAATSGGTGILGSTFNADSGFTNLGVIKRISAKSDGINLNDSMAIANSTFSAGKIGNINADITSFRGGAAIIGSTFTAQTAIYTDANGAFNNNGEIGNITVRNASRTGNGIESSTFLAGAAGKIGNINVDTTWQKLPGADDPFNRGASGKAIYLSSFRATGLDPDQAVMNGRIGNIIIKSGRVIPQILDPGLPPPNDQWTAAAAGIDLSYFAAYGGIGNIKINSIGTAIFGSAILANLDPSNGILGSVLSNLADIKPNGGIRNVDIRAEGRFASGIVLSALIGQQIRRLDVQARGGPQVALPFLQTIPNTPIPGLVTQISNALSNTPFNPIWQVINPDLLQQLNPTSLFQEINLGLAPITGSIVAATNGNIGGGAKSGGIRITNLNGGNPFFGSLFYASNSYGPVTTTARARKNRIDVTIEQTLAQLGYRRSNAFTRYLSAFVGKQVRGGNLPRAGSTR